jgi:RimJ/RimL family protein N-acetyltransferase
MLHGERITLRPFKSSDLPVMRDWFRDPDTARTWGRVPMVADDAFEADLAGRFRTFDRSGYFAIEDERGELVGRIDYERLDPVDRTAELMIMLGNPASRGHGLGGDALRTLIRHLFIDRQVERVWLTVLAWNSAAIRAYEKVGFVREGVRREDVWIDGAWHSQLVMGLLRYEFEVQDRPPRNHADQP